MVCLAGAKVPPNMLVGGLAVHDNTLFGVNDGFLFEANLDAASTGMVQLQYTPVLVRQRADSLRASTTHACRFKTKEQINYNVSKRIFTFHRSLILPERPSAYFPGSQGNLERE